VGLLGLDIVLSRLLARANLDQEEAADELFAAISSQNYIPPGKEELYRQALAKEYVRLLHGREREDDTLTIRILGPGCVSCNNLQTMVVEIMNRLGVVADIFQVHDLDEIGRFGVIQTPALLINGEIKSAGRLPTPAQMEAWLREYL